MNRFTNVTYLRKSYTVSTVNWIRKNEGFKSENNLLENRVYSKLHTLDCFHSAPFWLAVRWHITKTGEYESNALQCRAQRWQIIVIIIIIIAFEDIFSIRESVWLNWLQMRVFSLVPCHLFLLVSALCVIFLCWLCNWLLQLLSYRVKIKNWTELNYWNPLATWLDCWGQLVLSFLHDMTSAPALVARCSQ
jgi:hypothetical protein